MKNALKSLGSLFLSLLLLFPNQAVPKEGPQEDRVETLSLLLQHLQPKLKDTSAKELAQVILKEASINQLDWKLIVSILNQESSLRRDPQGCLKNADDCTGDYGIAQVRYKIWKDEFGLKKEDKKRLMTDYAYAVGTQVRILVHYREKYQNREFNWFTRYHSGTPEFRAVYMRHLNKSYEKINLFLESHYAKLNAQEAQKVASK